MSQHRKHRPARLPPGLGQPAHAVLDLRLRQGFQRVGAEEFIEGREFSVLVVENADNAEEPFAYQPVEFRFPEGESFKHFDLKWKDYEAMTCVQCDDVELGHRSANFSNTARASAGFC